MLKQKEWLDIIVEKTGCTKKEAKAYYDCVFDYIREQISLEESIKIASFGVFKLRKTAAKEQINLVTGEAQIVPEHNVVVFKPYFEIEPKPEAIEIENEVAEANEVVVEPAVIEEDDVEETPVEEVKEEASEPVEEKVVEEAPVEEVKEEVAEPTEEEVLVEEEIDDNLVWNYNGKKCNTNNVKQLLKQKTTLSEEDIKASIEVVAANMKKAGKTEVEVKEDDNSFNFVITK